MSTNNTYHHHHHHHHQQQRQTTRPPRRRRLLQENDIHIGIVGGGLAGLSTALAILRSAKSSTLGANSSSSTPQWTPGCCNGSSQQHHSHRVVKITIYERRCNPSLLSASASATTTSDKPSHSDNDNDSTNNNNNNNNNTDQDKGYGMTLTYDPVGPLAKLDILEEVAKRDCPSRCHYLFNEKGEVRGYFGNAFYSREWIQHPMDGMNREGRCYGGGGGGFGGQRGNMRIPRSELRNILLKKLMTEAEETKMMTNTETTTTTTTTTASSSSEENCNCDDAPANDSNLVVVDVEILWTKRLLSYVDRPMVEKLEKIHVSQAQQQRYQHDQHPQRPVSLLFDDGSSAQVDLLIGADGVHSVVARQYLSTRIASRGETMSSRMKDEGKGHQPQQQCQSTTKESYSSSSSSSVAQTVDAALPQSLGIFLILGISNHFHHLIDERGFYTLDGTHRLFVMPFQGSRLDDDYDIDDSENDYNDEGIGEARPAVVNGSISAMTNTETDQIQSSPHVRPSSQKMSRKRRTTMWQLSFPVSEHSEAIRLSELSQTEMQLEVLQRCGNWHAPIPDLVKETPLESIWGTSLLDRDPQVFIDHRKNLEIHGRLPSRVVILGDAAHPMSPFKGQGANQALADGPLLAMWLSKAQVDSAVRGFMSEMARRSGVKVHSSREAARELHSDDCWKWMAKQDKPVAAGSDIVEATFHGVQTQHVSTLLQILKERNVGATLEGFDIDDAIRGIIRELNCADTMSDSANFTSAELSQLQTNALIYASAGDLQMLRQLSRKSPLIILRALNGESKQSCLHLAAMQGHVDVCRWLLSEVNMDCYAFDADAKSALDLAVDAGHDKIARALKRWSSQLGESHEVGRDKIARTILADNVTSTMNESNHKEDDQNKFGTACNGEENDVYRHVEQQLRGIRSSQELRVLLQKNRDTNEKVHAVTHVLGYRLDADDAKRDEHSIKDLAAQGAVLLRKFVPREVDQLSIAALALRPLNLNLTIALRALGASDNCVRTIAERDSNVVMPVPASEKHKMYKVSEGIKSSMSITADASIIIQTNFWPQMQISPEENQRKKRRMNSFPLHRLRYINLGEFNYNWSSRLYEKIQGAKVLPTPLVTLAQRAYTIARQQTNEVRTAPVLFDMAICNIYHTHRSSDRLGGHKDNVESDLTLPLVTVSLGAPGIFLLGGMSRRDVPTAILLEAGDCMVMSGTSRQYYHGVPTILSDEPEQTDDHGFDFAAETYNVFPELSESGTLDKNADANDQSLPSFDELRFAKVFLSTVRMNISIRQV